MAGSPSESRDTHPELPSRSNSFFSLDGLQPDPDLSKKSLTSSRKQVLIFLAQKHLWAGAHAGLTGLKA
jgi:hypothetical protein